MAGANSRSDFEEVFLPHLDAAYSLARWLTRDPTDADDVVQEAYMRAFRFFSGFHGGDSRAWLLKIVRNTCYTWLKKNRSREIVYELEEDRHEAVSGNPEVVLQENIDRQFLKKLLDELPTTHREIIVLRDIEGLSYKEISSVMELPLGTVMSRLARARQRLQADAAATQTGVLG
ncbi:MAG TPA: sigma-70 family RNA polymerase sigma factor [Pyrinomonadaceae bacterium]|jgi:RNA polymerase sigma factor (sigma-70 family)|nr:sigma-70 family RNA polymerase sigma factor [Pyrinomonadaceae bacterium]